MAEQPFEIEDLQAEMAELKEKMEAQASSFQVLQTAKDKTEEGERKARDELRKAQEELKLKTESWAKAQQEAFEAQSSLKELTQAYAALSEANGVFIKELEEERSLGKKKDAKNAELRDDASTQWASGWIAFRRQARKTYPDLNFEFAIPTEAELEETDSDDEEDVAAHPTSSVASEDVEVSIPTAKAPTQEGSLPVDTPVNTPFFADLVGEALAQCSPTARVEVPVVNTSESSVPPAPGLLPPDLPSSVPSTEAASADLQDLLSTPPSPKD